MSLTVLHYQAFFWVLMTASYFVFGGWGLAVSVVVALLAAANLRRSDLWLLQVISTLGAMLVNLGWPELSLLLQETVNEAWGWNMHMSPLTLGSLGVSLIVVSVVLSIAIPEWRKRNQYGY